MSGQLFLTPAQPALAKWRELAEAVAHDNFASLCNGTLANVCLGTEQHDMAIGLFLTQLESARKLNTKMAVPLQSPVW